MVLADETLASAYRHLSLQAKVVLDLAYGEALPDREVASRLGISQSAAIKRRQRALELLPQLLTGASASSAEALHEQIERLDK